MFSQNSTMETSVVEENGETPKKKKKKNKGKDAEKEEMETTLNSTAEVISNYYEILNSLF